MAFCPDVKILASGSADRTVQLWRVASQEQVEEAAALLSLEKLVRTIGTADARNQRQVLDKVRSYSAAKDGQGFVQKDVFLATSTARALEENDNFALASQAYRSFAEVFVKSKDERFSNAVRTWEENARRLDSMAE